MFDFQGRSKALIKQRGYCPYPHDIEAVAESQEGVRSAIVVGRTEPDGDESAVLFIVAEPGADQDATTARVQNELPPALRPSFISFLDEWPPSPVGKIDLSVLKNIAKELS